MEEQAVSRSGKIKYNGKASTGSLHSKHFHYYHIHAFPHYLEIKSENFKPLKIMSKRFLTLLMRHLLSYHNTEFII